MDAHELTQRIRDHVKGNWLHQHEVTPDKELVPPPNLEFRKGVLDSAFSSLFADRTVLVYDEASGIYSALVHRAGARSVSASSASEQTCDLIREVSSFLEAPVDVVNSKLLGFYDGEPYVDLERRDGHDFLLAMGQTWPMSVAAGHDLVSIVEGCAFFVRHGLVFEWNDAEWASPPPPPEYNLDAFERALRGRFEFVVRFSNWLIVAVGKLPYEHQPQTT